jgi:integrase
MAALLAGQERGTPIPGSRLTVGRFLEQWLQDVVKPNVRPWTYKGYEVVVRHHLTPDLGSVPLVQLSPQAVQELLNRKLESGLSTKTVQSIRGVLRNALNEGQRWEVVTRNVASLVRVPRVERYPISPLTPSEARRLLEAARTDRLGALYSTALALGLRQGEALGLRWQDIDLLAGTVVVEHQLQRLNGKLVLVPLKTRASRRTLSVPDVIIDRLRVHSQHQYDERVAAGSRWTETNLVFTTTSGTGLDGPAVTKSFQRLLQRTGLERRRFHDLRHSCASLLLAQNVAPRVVMEILGHSQIALTMNTYSHVLPGLKKAAAESMGTILGPEGQALSRQE